MVITSVCGTENLGSIPSNRPSENSDTLICMHTSDLIAATIIIFAIGAGLGYYAAPLILGA